jgi:hypothetical protein
VPDGPCRSLPRTGIWRDLRASAIGDALARRRRGRGSRRCDYAAIWTCAHRCKPRTRWPCLTVGPHHIGVPYGGWARAEGIEEMLSYTETKVLSIKL